ncbi:hypothetical protein ACFE04_019209 [Oxalis oulophora]
MATPQPIPIIIKETTHISPMITEQRDFFNLPLTSFGAPFLKAPAIERLFFYESNNPSAEILPRLKQSLSLTLSHFPLLAGHLTWTPSDIKPSIHCPPNDRVSLMVAESNADFHRLSSKNVIVNALEHRCYIPELENSDEAASIVSLQITFFPSSGFCIGFVAHHAVLDDKSMIMFMRSWAYLCKNLDQNPSLPCDLTPFLDRTVIKDPTENLDMFYLDNMSKLVEKVNPGINPRSLKLLNFRNLGQDSVRATFDLSIEDIKRLREKVLLNAIDDDLHLSSFTLVYAHAIVCFVKAKDVEGKVKVHFRIVADQRSRLDPPVPEKYIGNCVSLEDLMTLEVEDITGEKGFEIVTKMISYSIKKLNSNNYFERAREIFKTYVGVDFGPLGLIGVAGSPKFEVYEVDFGWGRPEKVDHVFIDGGSCFGLAQSKDQIGGVEVGLVMKSRVEMDAFESYFVHGIEI